MEEDNIPTWKIHNKWANELGISNDVASFVNGLIDFPDKNQEYKDYCYGNPETVILCGKKKTPTKTSIVDYDFHDSGRSNPHYRKLQIDFLTQKGQSYITAWYLHQILDYLTFWTIGTQSANEINLKDILTDKKITQKIGDSKDPQLIRVVDFVFNNSESIICDLRE